MRKRANARLTLSRETMRNLQKLDQDALVRAVGGRAPDTWYECRSMVWYQCGPWVTIAFPCLAGP